jgi:hypothetical protein
VPQPLEFQKEIVCQGLEPPEDRKWFPIRKIHASISFHLCTTAHYDFILTSSSLELTNLAKYPERRAFDEKTIADVNIIR